MNKVLNLQPRRAFESVRMPAYMAVEMGNGADAGVAEGLQAVTPRLMRWSETVWLLDLSLCASYWEARSITLGASALDLIRSVIEGLSTGGVRAALAEHPWQALLLLTAMRERKLTGVVQGAGHFGETLFKDLSWEAWWLCAQALGEHFEKDASGVRRKFVSTQFKSQCAQMRRAVKRIGLAVPYQLRSFQPAAVQRRFGAVLRDMSQWAYGPSTSGGGGLFCAAASEGLFESGFPWQSFVFTSLPSITRHLETPLCEWSHMEGLLREDFDRLCGLSSWLSGEKVVSLEWQLVLPDWSYLVIPIRFRHPHSLHLEKGCHATSLLQALYAFESSRLRPLGYGGQALQIEKGGLVRHSCEKSGGLVRHSFEKSGGLVRHSPEGDGGSAVLGWTLVIRERLRLPPRSAGLFGDHAMWVGDGKGMQSADEMALLQLENKLKVPLERFALHADWVPEDAYSDARDVPEMMLPGAELDSLHVIALERPLYVYKQPMRFDPGGRSCVWRFTERTMGKWWVGGGRNLQRDYYRLTDGDHRDQWVFKDTSGQTFVHGVFA